MPVAPADVEAGPDGQRSGVATPGPPPVSAAPATGVAFARDERAAGALVTARRIPRRPRPSPDDGATAPRRRGAASRAGRAGGHVLQRQPRRPLPGAVRGRARPPRPGIGWCATTMVVDGAAARDGGRATGASPSRWGAWCGRSTATNGACAGWSGASRCGAGSSGCRSRACPAAGAPAAHRRTGGRRRPRRRARPARPCVHVEVPAGDAARPPPRRPRRPPRRRAAPPHPPGATAGGRAGAGVAAGRRNRRSRCPPRRRGGSLSGRRCLHTAEVAGSKPVSPTAEVTWSGGVRKRPSFTSGVRTHEKPAANPRTPRVTGGPSTARAGNRPRQGTDAPGRPGGRRNLATDGHRLGAGSGRAGRRGLAALDGAGGVRCHAAGPARGGRRCARWSGAPARTAAASGPTAAGLAAGSWTSFAAPPMSLEHPEGMLATDDGVWAWLLEPRPARPEPASSTSQTARYDPSSHRLISIPAPPDRTHPLAVWTGSKLYLLGGSRGFGPLQDGVAWSPAEDAGARAGAAVHAPLRCVDRPGRRGQRPGWCALRLDGTSPPRRTSGTPVARLDEAAGRWVPLTPCRRATAPRWRPPGRRDRRGPVAIPHV